MAVIDQTKSTDNLRKLFERAANIKKNTLDMLARQFKSKYPAFHQPYLVVSKAVYKKASRKTNGEVTNSEVLKELVK